MRPLSPAGMALRFPIGDGCTMNLSNPARHIKRHPIKTFYSAALRHGLSSSCTGSSSPSASDWGLVEGLWGKASRRRQGQGQQLPCRAWKEALAMPLKQKNLIMRLDLCCCEVPSFRRIRLHKLQKMLSLSMNDRRHAGVESNLGFGTRGNRGCFERASRHGRFYQSSGQVMCGTPATRCCLLFFRLWCTFQSHHSAELKQFLLQTRWLACFRLVNFRHPTVPACGCAEVTPYAEANLAHPSWYRCKTLGGPFHFFSLAA